MCSIIAGKTTKIFKDNIKSYMELLSHRGEKQGCGYIVKDENGLTIHRSMDINTVVDGIQEMSDKAFVIVHQRKASVGTVNLTNAHPVKGNEGTVRLIHNGTRKIYNEFFDATSDSQGLASFLELLPPKYHGKVMRELGVVFYTYKGQNLYMYKDELRPLVKLKGHSLFASEPLFNGEWATVKEQHEPIIIEDGSSIPVDKFRQVTYASTTYAKYCTSCKKIQLTAVSGVCGVCEAMGKKLLPVTNYHKTSTTHGTGKTSTTSNGLGNDESFQVVKGVQYKVDRNCIKPKNNSLLPNVKYTATINYTKQVTKHTLSLYMTIHLGQSKSVYEVNIKKFAEYNKLIKNNQNKKGRKRYQQNLAIIRKGKCKKCSDCTVTTGNFKVCSECKAYTMCHI